MGPENEGALDRMMRLAMGQRWIGFGAFYSIASAHRRWPIGKTRWRKSEMAALWTYRPF